MRAMYRNLLQIGSLTAILAATGCNQTPSITSAAEAPPRATPAPIESPASPAMVASNPSSGSGKLIQIHIDNSADANYRCDGNNVFQLEGSSNAVRITGHCSLLQVDGNDNAITIDQVNSVQIQGSGNAITWLSGNKPSFAAEGSSNAIHLGGNSGGVSNMTGNTSASSSGRRIRTANGDVDVQGSSGETVQKQNGTTTVRGSSGASVQVNPDGSTTIQSSSGKVLKTTPQPQ